MKKIKYKAIVNLPKKSNDKNKIIDPNMYFWQNKEIILEKFNDPDYDFIDENCYYFDIKKQKLLIKKSTPKNLDKLCDLARKQGMSTLFCVTDGFMWSKEWLKNISLIVK